MLRSINVLWSNLVMLAFLGMAVARADEGVPAGDTRRARTGATDATQRGKGPARNSARSPHGEDATAEMPGAKTGDGPDDAEAIVYHDPIGTRTADTDWLVRVRISAVHKLSAVYLHWRGDGSSPWANVLFERSEKGDYIATVKAVSMRPGRIWYWIGSSSALDPEAAERAHFASPAAPHPVSVLGNVEVEERQILLAQHLSNRSRFSFNSEYVDFGSRDYEMNTSNRDHYWRAEADYTYRLLRKIYSIRLGAGMLRGDTFQLGVVMNGMPALIEPKNSLGLYYAVAGVRFRFGRLFLLDVTTTVGGAADGFTGGGGGQVMIGYDTGTHFAVGGDYVYKVGFRNWMRLAWNTVPQVPMRFTIEVTNLPNDDNNNVAGRAFFGAGFRFNRYFSVNAYGGYAARDFKTGGPCLGLGVELEL